MCVDKKYGGKYPTCRSRSLLKGAKGAALMPSSKFLPLATTGLSQPTHTVVVLLGIQPRKILRLPRGTRDINLERASLGRNGEDTLN
jgi:hypothetical protein